MDSLLGVVFGLGLAILIVNFLKKRRFGAAKRKKSRLTQTREFVLPVDHDAAFDRSKEAIKLFNLKLERVDVAAGEFVAVTGIDWRSIGEIIVISLKREGAGTRVTIESSPAIGYCLVDYGRNKSNVDALSNLIQKK